MASTRDVPLNAQSARVGRTIDETDNGSSMVAPLAIGALLATAYALASANPELTFGAFASLGAMLLLVWRRGDCPVLAVAFGLQWLQAALKIIQANIQGKPINIFTGDTAMDTASALSLLGIVGLGVGARLALRAYPPPAAGLLRAQAESLSVQNLFLLYLASFALSAAILNTPVSLPGSLQLRVLADVKWIFFVALAITVLVRRENYAYLMLIFGLEIGDGLASFFSDFKKVFIVFAIVYLTVRTRVSIPSLISFSTLCAVVFGLGMFWTAIKPQYRDFLSGGTMQQVVTVSMERRMEKLAELGGKVTIDDMLAGLDEMANRIAYVELFAATLRYVPSKVPHADGEIFAGAILNIIQPRVFFPNKPALPSDSELTIKYTGIGLASGDTGTSISIGYFGEGYIDFGPIFMFLPIMAIGYGCGWMYNSLIGARVGLPFGIGAATMVLVNQYQIEMVTTKLVAGMLNHYVLTLLFMGVVMPKLLPYMSRNATRDTR